MKGEKRKESNTFISDIIDKTHTRTHKNIERETKKKKKNQQQYDKNVVWEFENKIHTQNENTYKYNPPIKANGT